jgi:hypothetical protein
VVLLDQRIILKVCESGAGFGTMVGYKQFLMCLAAVAFQAFEGTPSEQVRECLFVLKRVWSTCRTDVMLVVGPDTWVVSHHGLLWCKG